MQHRGTSTRKCLSLPIRAHFIERDMFSFSGLEDSVILQIFFPGPAECGGAQAPWSWEVEQLAHGRHRWESDNLPTKTVSAEYTLDFIAGLVAGCAGLVIGHPFDTIKVRQQLNSSQTPMRVRHVVAETLRHEGPRGFFKGMAFPLAAVGVLNSVFFGVYGNTLRLWYSTTEDDSKSTKRSPDSTSTGSSCSATGTVKLEGVEETKALVDLKPSYLAICIAGGFAGAVQGVPATPIDLVKVRLQAQTGAERGAAYRGPWDCLLSVHQQHGVRGCFRGITPTIWRELPGFAVYITSYEYMCNQLKSRDQHQQGDLPSVPVMLLAGGLAGMLSWMANIPIDVIKSRMQSDDLTNPRYRSMSDCWVKSYREEGWRVFCRGLPVICLRAFPSNAVTLAVYSTSYHLLKDVYHGTTDQSEELV